MGLDCCSTGFDLYLFCLFLHFAAQMIGRITSHCFLNAPPHRENSPHQLRNVPPHVIRIRSSSSTLGFASCSTTIRRCSSSNERHNNNKTTLITTPIFYVNSSPHLGHLYRYDHSNYSFQIKPFI